MYLQTRQKLENGNIVKLRDGNLFLVWSFKNQNNVLSIPAVYRPNGDYSDFTETYHLLGVSSSLSSDEYNNDLTHKQFNEKDIVTIYGIKNYRGLSYLLDNSNINELLYPIWNRSMKMTIKEIEQALGHEITLISEEE